MTDFASLPIDAPDNPTLLELLKWQLEIEPFDTSRNKELSIYLEMAGQAAEKYIGNAIEKREMKENLSHARTPVALRYSPYGGDLVVTVDGVDVSTDYEVFTDDGLSWAVRDISGSSRETSFSQMTISYTAGYNPLPADLGYALVQSGEGYAAGGSGGSIKRESVVGVGSTEYYGGDEGSGATRVGQLPASAVSVLDSYLRWHA